MCAGPGVWRVSFSGGGFGLNNMCVVLTVAGAGRTPTETPGGWELFHEQGAENERLWIQYILKGGLEAAQNIRKLLKAKCNKAALAVSNANSDLVVCKDRLKTANTSLPPL